MGKDVGIVCGGVGAIYSKIMPKKSSELKRFLREQHVVPVETYELSDFNPDDSDSPEDVGLFISGGFYHVGMVLRDTRSFVHLLREEKQRELELAMSRV